MKILIVSEFMPYPFLGGLARHAINLGNQLIKIGHEVDILGNGNNGSKEKVSEMRFNGNVYLDRAIDRSRLIVRIEKYIKIYPIWLHILIAKRIAKSIMKYAPKYDVIHYHGHYPIVARYIPADINFVITHHDHSLSCPKKTFLLNNTKPCSVDEASNSCAKCHLGVEDSLREWVVLKSVKYWRSLARDAINCHKHVFVSKRLSDLILSVLNQSDVSVNIIHNFIDCDLIKKYLSSEDGNRLENAKTKVIIANNIDPFKGIKNFLQEVHKNNVLAENIEIVIAGDGSQKNELETAYKERGVKFLGHIPQPEAIKAISDSDVYILSSICEESCSTGVLEGLFLNKDVRALNRGGTPELKAYASDKKQLKLYDDMQSLVLSLLTDTVYKSDDTYNANFNCCVSDKVNDLMDVYKR